MQTEQAEKQKAESAVMGMASDTNLVIKLDEGCFRVQMSDGGTLLSFGNQKRVLSFLEDVIERMKRETDVAIPQASCMERHGVPVHSAWTH